MFIVCFIHSFWTCGNQNQWCDYTFCCLPPTSSGQLLWWWQQLSCKVSINLLDWYFSPVDNFPPCKASFSTSLLFAARVRGNLSSHFPETLCQIAAQTLARVSASWAPPQIYVCSSWPSSPLLLCFACLTGYLHAVSSVSLCLPVIASDILPYVIINDKHRERVTCTAAPGQLLLQVWLSRTCLLGRNPGSVIHNCACTAVYSGYIITVHR